MDHALPREDSRKGLAMTISVAFHGLLLLGFLLLKIVTPLPPYPEGGGEGMALGIADIGYSLEGMGDGESMEESGATQAATPQPTPESDDQFITEDDGEAINKDPDPTKKPTDKPVVTKPVNRPPKITEPTVDKNLADALNTSWGKPGKEEGKGTKPGDPGSADGVKGGGGVFNGNGWELRGGNGSGGKGRGLSRGPDLSEKPELANATWVEVMVVVDRQGNVIRVSVANTGTSDTRIQEVAKRAARTCKFVALPDGPPEQQHFIKLRFFPG